MSCLESRRETRRRASEADAKSDGMADGCRLDRGIAGKPKDGGRRRSGFENEWRAGTAIALAGGRFRRANGFTGDRRMRRCRRFDASGSRRGADKRRPRPHLRRGNAEGEDKKDR